MDKNYMLLITKPGFVQHQKEIDNVLLNNNINIVEKFTSVLNKEKAVLHYEEHIEKPFFERLVTYITEGKIGENFNVNPTVCILIIESTITKETYEDFIQRVRKLVKEIIRPKFALKKEKFKSLTQEEFENICKTANVMHASDSPTAAQKEISNLFENHTTAKNSLN